MIALIEGVLCEVTPIISTDIEPSIRMNDKGDIEAYIGQNRVDYGVLFHSFNKSVNIDAKTGKITKNSGKYAKIRGIFHDNHVDLELNTQETA